jgi:hypothetical protein
MSITPQQEQAILEAAHNNAENLGALLKAALEASLDTMEFAAFDLLCDKVTQILSEAVREARGWNEEVKL